MAESISLGDGSAVDVTIPEPVANVTEPTVPAPPKRQPKDPDAPYGRRADGSPKKGPGGRPAKADKPRVVAGDVTVQVVSKADLAKDCEETIGFAAVVLDMAGRAANHSGHRAAAYILNDAAAPLGQSLADVAQVSPMMAKLLKSGGKTTPWVGLIFTGYQVAAQVSMVYRNPELAKSVIAQHEPQPPESDEPDVPPEG